MIAAVKTRKPKARKGPARRPARRDPVARALRGLRPRVVPKGTLYSRKRLAKTPDEDG